jgi:hypothetical protein
MKAYMYLSRIAEKLELPTKPSGEETRQIIKGKLLEMPHNIQIELEERDSEFILLRDIDGMFLETETPTKGMMMEGDTESVWWRVSDLIMNLECTLWIAYAVSTETRDALLYGQFREALRYELMRPAVSGSTEYQELCVA